jgi:hypothetical protein
MQSQLVVSARYPFIREKKGNAQARLLLLKTTVDFFCLRNLRENALKPVLKKSLQYMCY